MRRLVATAASIPLLSLGLADCHRRPASQPASAGQTCIQAESALLAGADPSHLPGSYDVTFVATGGLQAGHAAQGRLELRLQDDALVRLPPADSLSQVSQPVVGTLAVATDSIGATRMGDLMATDARQPGVGVYVTRRAGGAVTAMVARLGSASNGRGVVAFDGGHFTLHIRRVDAGGIWGDWASNPGPGPMVTADARGYFCAERARR